MFNVDIGIQQFIRFTKPLLAVLLCMIAFFHAANGQPPSLEKARGLHESAGERIKLQTAESFKKAKEEYGQAAEIFSDFGDKTGEAKSLVGVAFTTNELGDREDALRVYQIALSIFKDLKNDLWSARCLNNMARIYDDTGNPTRALELFNEAIPLRRAASDLYGEAVTTSSIGAVYAATGEYQKAIDFYERALQLRRSPNMEISVENTKGIAIILNNIGRTYDELGDYPRAVKFLTESLSIRKEVGDRIGEAITLNNLGLASHGLGQNEKGIEYLKKALVINEELVIPTLAGTIRNNLAMFYIEMNRPDEAMPNLDIAIETYRKIGDRGGEAVALVNFAQAETLKGLDTSRFRLHSALLIARQIGDKSLESQILNNLMIDWKKRGNPSIAVFYGKQSVNNYQEIRRANQKLDDDIRKTYLISITTVYRELADLLIELGQFAQAKQVLNMLKAEEYFDFVRRDSDEIKNLGLKVDLTERERALIKRYVEIADEITALSAEFLALESEKSKALRADDEMPAAKTSRYEELSAKLEVANAAFRLFIEKQLIDELGKNRVKDIEYDRSLQSKLRNWGNDTVAVYTVVTPDRYRVVMTTPSTQIDGKTEISEKDLNKKVFEFRESLQDLNSDPRVKGKELYDVLLKPIEKALKASGAKTIIWSLDGTLRYIPVSALSPDGKSYLIEHYQNAVITSETRDDIADRRTAWRPLGLGVSKATSITNPSDPESVLEFSAIPGSLLELNSIIRDETEPEGKGLLLGKRYIDEAFTKSVFEDSLAMETADGKSKYSVVHLASHFRLGSNWSDSFLLLGNGKYLTLEQIIDSPTLNFGDVELVTLSACDTAFASDANGREIDSLAEAIQTKSGKAVLATLWAVVDESTPLLMTEFYRLQKEKPSMTKSEAIQKVQQAFVNGRIKPDDAYIERLAGEFPVRGSDASSSQFVFDKKKPFAHPYFWSPFVLIGNWR